MALQSETDVVTAALREAGLSYTLEHRGKHVKVTWFAGGRRHVYACAKTPSDWRAMLNCRSRVRRMLRQQQGATIEASAA